MFENAVYPASSSKLFAKTATQLSELRSSSHSNQSTVEPSRMIDSSSEKELKSPLINSVVALANETAIAGYGALIFCSSRAGAERDAELISRVLQNSMLSDSHMMEGRNDLLNDLRSTATGLDQTLEKTIRAGVAFHRELYLYSAVSTADHPRRRIDH